MMLYLSFPLKKNFLIFSFSIFLVTAKEKLFRTESDPSSKKSEGQFPIESA